MNSQTQTKVSVTPVQGKADQKAFIKFAWTLYAGDENWIPPLRMNIKELLNYKKHPFYETAEIQTFLARDADGKIVGRIAAIVDRAHNDFHDEQLGMFGFFESVDDTSVSRALFDTAKNWFAERKIRRMRGPANPSQNYEWGLLVDGFDSPPTFMMTYNKPYYDRLVVDYGFEKSQDMYAFGGPISLLDELDPKLKFIADEAQRRFNVDPRPVSKKEFKRDVRSFLEIYNAALPGQWGFTPLSRNELIHMAEGLKFLIAPEMTTIAEIDGKAVAVTFGLLDYNPVIKKIDGRLFPFGAIRLMLAKKKLTKIRLISTNVLPAYQKWGLGLVLMKRLVPEVKNWGIENAEFSWVLESNKLSRGTLERSGAKLLKTYRIYDFDPS